MEIETLQNLISPFFDNSTILDIAKNYGYANPVIEAINILPDSQKIGDSYLSKIVRFTMEISTSDNGKSESHSIPVFIKALPKNLGRRKTFRSPVFFRNEAAFYSKVWAAFELFIKSKSMKKEFEDLVPKLLAYHIDGENDFLALEDLSYKDYTTVDRSSGLSHQNAIRSIQLLAKFHGISIAFKDQNKDKFLEIANALEETYLSEKYRWWYKDFQDSLCEIVRDSVKRHLPAKYYEKVDAIYKDDFYTKTCEAAENNRGPLSVVTQGDSWIPNFLIKKDESKIALIDFQLARFASLSTDLVFFIYACIEEPNLSDHWSSFLSEYCKTINNTVHSLGTTSFKLDTDALKEEMKKNVLSGFAMSMEAVPMSLLEEDECTDLDTLEITEAVPLNHIWKLHPFKDEKRSRRISNMIKHIIDNDIL